MGLIKTAITVPSVVEGDRHERVPRLSTCMLVVGLGKPTDQTPVLVILVVVLEAENGLEYLTARPVSGACPLEVPAMFRAFVTDDGRVHVLQRGERLAALPAERRHDADRFSLGARLPREREIQRAFAPVPGVGSGTTEGCR